MGIIEVEKTITKIGRPVFTTRDISLMTGISLSATVQTLCKLEEAGLVLQIKRGLWHDCRQAISPYDVVPYLSRNQPVYVSFISALHLHGVVGQIPQIVTVASISHSRTVKTVCGTYRVYQINPDLFGGYGWHKGEGRFLIASPEKALVDAFYISGRKGRSFASFPELDLSKIKKGVAKKWALRISHGPLRQRVFKHLDRLFG